MLKPKPYLQRYVEKAAWRRISVLKDGMIHLLLCNFYVLISLLSIVKASGFYFGGQLHSDL